MARKKQSDTQTKKLFPDEQGDLFERSYQVLTAYENPTKSKEIG
jgi:hypothetical protein